MPQPSGPLSPRPPIGGRRPTRTDLLAAFLRTEAYVAYEAEVAPLLLGPPGVRRLTPTWSKTTG